MNYFRAVANYLSEFGCCTSCAEVSTTQGTEPNERTHLIDPVCSPAVRAANSDDFISEFQNSLPNEQSALNKIVQETATNIIDVAAMDTHNLETQEYNDRKKIYSHRLTQQWNSVHHPGESPRGLLVDIPNPEPYLSANPVSIAELAAIKKFVERSTNALYEMKVEHTEDLIVPFRIS